MAPDPRVIKHEAENAPGDLDEGPGPETEVLTLPEGNAETWRAVRATLDRFCAADEHGTAKTLTGGAILAGRFAHRMSSDVDAHLRRIPSFDILKPSRMHGAQLDRAMREVGAKRIYSSSTQIIFEFENGEKLDLIAGRLFPKPYGEPAIVEGEPAEVATNAQIIATKVKARGALSPARDLYDLVVAARHDRAGVAEGVNALPAEDLALASKSWAGNARRLREEARTMKAVPEALAWITDDPARFALETLRQITWRTMTLHYTEQGAKLEGERNGERAQLAGPITDDKAMTEALIMHGAYEDPTMIRLDVEMHMGRTESAMRGQAREPEVVKEVILKGDAPRAERAPPGLNALGGAPPAAEKPAAQEVSLEGDAPRAERAPPGLNALGGAPPAAEKPAAQSTRTARWRAWRPEQGDAPKRPARAPATGRERE